MKDSLKTKKIVIVSVVSAVTAFLIYGGLFFVIKNQNEKVAELSSISLQNSKKDEAVRLIKMDFDKNKGAIADLDTYFISKDGAVDFINTLDKIGKQSGAELSIGEVDSELDNHIEDDFKETINVRLDATGSWNQVYLLLIALENMPIKLKVEQVSLGLMSAADKMSFVSASSTVPELRTQSSAEKWKATIYLSVIKIR